jgi:hypothetical protein
MIKNTKPIIIMGILIATVLLSGMAFGTLSFAASSGIENVYVSLCNGTTSSPCKHNPPKPLPTSGIPVVASCKWDPPNDKKTCLPNPFEFTLKARGLLTAPVKIEEFYSGSYEISVHPIPAGVNPTYAGHCHSDAITPGKSVTCIIDPYG